MQNPAAGGDENKAEGAEQPGEQPSLHRGAFFPLLFIGGKAGVAVHELIRGLRVALAFSTLFAAIPASLGGASFALILLAALTTQIGTLQTAPIAIAVLVAYLAVAGSGTLAALARRGHKTS